MRTSGSTWNERPAPRHPYGTLVLLGRSADERDGQALIEDAGNRKLVSIASCWEIAIKAGLGKLKLGEPSQSFLTREIARNNFQLLPISLTHAAMVENLAHHHKDPFDRLLIAQAIVERMPIVTADQAFDPYLITRLW